MRPRAASGYRPHPGGFAYAVDLVRGLKSVADFEISVAAYPEGASGGAECGVRPGQSQGQDATPAPIAPSRSSSSIPIYSCAFAIAARPPASARSLVPGILPITRFPQMLRFAERCGTHGAGLAAASLRRAGGRCRHAPHDRRGVCHRPGRGAGREGVDEFHFYTLNRADLTYAICHALGVRASPVEPPRRRCWSSAA